MIRLAAILTFFAGPLSAMCAPLPNIAAFLEGEHGEVLVWMGATSDGRVAYTFGNAETQGWSTVLAAPGGQACIVAYGTGYKMIDTPQGEPA